jgi:hypothetical protein
MIIKEKYGDLFVITSSKNKVIASYSKHFHKFSRLKPY